MIAAVGDNRVIGNGNRLPWEMPADMRYFMRTTLGHHIIMGRTSFEDIGKPLTGRTNIVLTRAPAMVERALLSVLSESATALGKELFVLPALEAALEFARNRGETETFIIGGEQVFRAGLSVAQRLYLTRIHGTFEGDTFFPEFDERLWIESSRTGHKADAENPFDYTFTVWERR